MDDFFTSERRRRLVLRRDRERTISNRHPWVFSGAIAADEGPEDAAIADLVSGRSGELIASGFYSAHSQIRLRAMTFGEPFTEQLLRHRIIASIDRRDALGQRSDAYRLIHAEGDGISGLVVDKYGSSLVCEITSAGLEKLREAIIALLKERTGATTIILKNKLPARRLEKISMTDEILGEPVQEIDVRENGLHFCVSLTAGQKTGFFLDQRENRNRVRELARDASVLNLFSYSGGFGVNAAAGGASSVEEVDISETAMTLARENHRLNGSAANVTFTVSDAFAHARELVAAGRLYDIVVCDPPAFARNRGDVDRAARGYKDINMQAMKLVRPGGLLMTFSCSGHIDSTLFQQILFAAALDSRREARMLDRLGAGIDHPVSLYCPETEYLKGMLIRVD